MHSRRKGACRAGLLPRNARRNWITITAGSSVPASRRAVSRNTNGDVPSLNLSTTPSQSFGEASRPLVARSPHSSTPRTKSPTAAKCRSATLGRGARFWPSEPGLPLPPGALGLEPASEKPGRRDPALGRVGRPLPHRAPLSAGDAMEDASVPRTGLVPAEGSVHETLALVRHCL